MQPVLRSLVRLAIIKRAAHRWSRLRNRHFIAFDFLLLLLTPSLAMLLRLDTLVQLWAYREDLIIYTGMALVIRVPLFYLGGLYSRYWRYASVDELIRIAVIVTFSSSLIVLAFFAGFQAELLELPRSIPFIDALLVLLLVGGGRYSVRLAANLKHVSPPREVEPVVIMGAGDAGTMIARELRTSNHLDIRPVAFIDDDWTKQNVIIQGVPVAGKRGDIPQVVKKYGASRVIIAMPTAPGKEIREIVNICEKAQVKTQIIPGMYELLDGTVQVEQLRNVEIEDLLRREPIETDRSGIRRLLAGRRVLITGGGGSIGSELSVRCTSANPRSL
ncbi:MAG: hypothetical protein R3272_11155 [Candidatus Promineifilaceae bacterium]|nr:hypothetical protein [Candidatus Promineifilaceae bacterium]